MVRAHLIAAVHMYDGREPQLELYVADGAKEARRFVKKWASNELSVAETFGGYPGEARIVGTVEIDDGLPPVFLELLLEARENGSETSRIPAARNWLVDQKKV